MARLEALVAWVFVSLGIVLLGGSILVVPANAFADAGDDCATQCGDDPMCTQSCCDKACDFNPACSKQCFAQVTCRLGNPYCVWGTQALCEGRPNDCQGTLWDCQCLWDDTKTRQCNCQAP